MQKRIDRARAYAELLASLARTGSVHLSLIAAGVSRQWVHCRRTDDPAFDAAWRTAAEAGQRTLRAAAARSAPSTSSGQAGVKVPEGMMLTGSSGEGTIRLARARADRFTNAKRAIFLDQLRTTCNVTEAAEAAGISKAGVYHNYHADRVFRSEWDTALAEGRVHLEMALIGAARAMLEGAAPSLLDGGGEGPPAITGMNAEVAVKVLRLHETRKPKGSGVKPFDRDKTVREIMAKIAAVKAARANGYTGQIGN